MKNPSWKEFSAVQPCEFFFIPGDKMRYLKTDDGKALSLAGTKDLPASTIVLIDPSL